MQLDDLNYVKRLLNVVMERLRDEVYTDQRDLKVEFSNENTDQVWPPPTSWRKLATGEQWGDAWSYGWFKLSGKWSKEDIESKNCIMHLDLGGEGQIFEENGKQLTAISRFTVFLPNSEKVWVELPDAQEGEFTYYARVSAHYLNGLAMDTEAYRSTPMNYNKFNAAVGYAHYGVRNQDIFDFRRELKLVSGMLKTSKENYRSRKIAGIAQEALNCYADNYNNIPAARKVLEKLWQLPAEAIQPKAVAVGHAHLDIGWLWTVEEGGEKAIRTFAEQITHIERSDDYIFGASQPYLYEQIEKRCPELFKRIQKAVAAGRWELQGGMYVEADTNCAGGEAIVRQFLYGKRYFKQKFGVDVKTVWLPDSFGFSGILPQIAQKSGCFAMVTAKPFWAHDHERELCSKFPYSHFRWQGIGGNEILVNILTECYYNGTLQPENFNDVYEYFTENDLVDEFIVSFGVGDGGGGPNMEMVKIGRMQKNLLGSPRVEFSRAAASLERQNLIKERFPLHAGEIYLELHRGTLTTISKIKKLNRMIEGKLFELDYLNAIVPEPIKASELEKIWKILLLNQFHDILPGSSIPELYRRNFAALEALIDETEKHKHALAEQLLEKNDNAVTLFNPHAVDCTSTVKLPDDWQSVTGDYPQELRDGALAVRVNVPAHSSITLYQAPGAAAAVVPQAGFTLENSIIRYTFDKNGHLIEAYDKAAGYQMIAPGKYGNDLKLYVDRPTQFDAWDVEIDYERMAIAPDAVRLIEHSKGACSEQLTFEFKFNKSTILQTIVLNNNSARLDFRTDVNWHENHRMLRTDFPLSIDFDNVRCEQGFGFIRRSARRNTINERHCFEFAAQRCILAGDGMNRAALMSDCKYGYKAANGAIGLNILRSPRYPDEITDRGLLSCTYSFMVYSGMSDEIARSEALELNRPPMLLTGLAGTVDNLLQQINIDGVSVEALKVSEDDPAIRVLRLVEQYGNAVTGEVKFNRPCSIAESDLQENPLTPWSGLQQQIDLEFKPFEIKTLMLK